MPDYIYLLENRLSADQQNALRQLREAAREAGTILFLIGDAVRDLTSGHAVRDLEVAVHGNALKLKKTIEKLGGKVWGEDEASRALYLCFPGTVRVDLVSTHRIEYSKPGKPVYHPASIQEDLRRRDFTVNAMAISLNEGSFGLLMDPMNGAADIESRTLRLVSNYGFLEDSSLLIRATRYMARLGWEMDPKTHTRYDYARKEGIIEELSLQARSRELEQIGHEEEGLKILQALEAEGWMKVLFPAWTSAKADEESLTALHDLAVELLLQGVHADISAAQIRLLTAKLAPKELTALKKLMLRPGFVEEWNNLDALAAGFAKALVAKENATPSASFKLFMNYDPEAVLWLGFTSKNATIRERFNQFLKLWPEARQRIPHALMQEMRITVELPSYREIVEAVFLEMIDGKLSSPEELRAFLDPYSPPAPPPRETIKRPRIKRGSEVKLKENSFDDEDESDDHLDEEDLDDISEEDDDLDLGLKLHKVDLEIEIPEESEIAAAEDGIAEEEANSGADHKTAPVKRVTRPPAPPKPVKQLPSPVAAPVETRKPAATPAAPKQKKAKKPQPAPKPKAQPKTKSRPAPALPAKSASIAAKTHAPAVRPNTQSARAKVSLSPSRKPAPPVKPAPKKAPAKGPTPKFAPSKRPVSAPSPKPAKLSRPAVKKPVPKPKKKR